MKVSVISFLFLGLTACASNTFTGEDTASSQPATSEAEPARTPASQPEKENQYLKKVQKKTIVYDFGD